MSPLENSFFEPPKTPFSQLEFTNAFGRTENLSQLHSICQYTGPKKGNGTQPGIEATCNGLALKVKFEEIHVQALVTRVLWALGYHTRPADYHSGLQIAYDRKIFSEFNRRTGVSIQLKIFRRIRTVAQVNPQYDPADYFTGAILQNGNSISAAELEKKIAAEKDDDIATVVTTPVQLQYADIPGQTTIGPWSYNDLDHAQLKSVRALAVVSAWLALYDLRTDNNRLVLQKDGDQLKLQFLLSDLGSGLGRSRFRFSSNNVPDDMNLFKPRVASGHRIRGAQVNEPNDAFTEATRSDFAAGVRLINQFSADQIEAILRVSGYQGEELNNFKQKLISRRLSLNRAFL